MSEQMKLLIEDAAELQTEVLVELNESTGEKTKNYYIHGTFSTPDKKNRNGRVYSTKLWENAIAGWREKVKVDNKFRLGEMEHPSRVDPDPMKAVIKITSLRLEEGMVMGRAKILNDNSPTTNKMKALIDEGIKIGVSSRGTGRMKGQIVEEFNLSTYDVVQSPSDYNAMLSGIVESTETSVSLNESTGNYVCDENGCSLEDNKAPLHETKCSEAAEALTEAFNQFAYVPKEISEAEQKAMDLIAMSESAYKKLLKKYKVKMVADLSPEDREKFKKELKELEKNESVAPQYKKEAQAAIKTLEAARKKLEKSNFEDIMVAVVGVDKVIEELEKSLKG